MKRYLTIFEDRIATFSLEMQGDYIIGRSSEECEQFAQLFSDPPTLIIFKGVMVLSGMHCVLYEDKVGYQIIDGWGSHHSTNGVCLNGDRIREISPLKHGDFIILGCKDIILLYEIDRFSSADEEDTYPQNC